MNEIRIPFKANTFLFSILVVVHIFFAFYTGSAAMKVGQGHFSNYHHEFYWSPKGGFLFLCIISIIFTILAIVTIACIIRSNYIEKFILIDDKGISWPRGNFSNKYYNISFKQIKSVELTNYNYSKFIKIEGGSDKPVYIAKNYISGEYSFNEIYELLQERTGRRPKVP